MAQAVSDRIKCLLLPMQNGTLLLPNSVVAEIVPAQRHQRPRQMGVDWLIGVIEWRGMKLPLISMESLFEPGEREFPTKTSFVVMHRLNQSPEFEYYAVCIDGIPHFQFIGTELPEVGTAANHNRFVAHFVSIDGGSALIPDLDAVEQELDRLDISAVTPAEAF